MLKPAGTMKGRAAIFSRLRRRVRRRPLGPGMALYLLSPVVAELCSGSTPALNYIFFGWMLCLMYGGGARSEEHTSELQSR
jgi:hypothetical protein